MSGRVDRRGFTLIELLVVMGIIITLASMLLVGISAARKYVQRASTKTMIDNLGMALQAYKTEFGVYPPGGVDVADDGNLFNTAGDDPGAGKPGTTPDLMQLRTVCAELIIRDIHGNEARRVGPYYNPNKINVRNGALIDVFGNVLCYLTDGRRVTIDPGTGEPFVGRVYERIYTLWSIA